MFYRPDIFTNAYHKPNSERSRFMTVDEYILNVLQDASAYPAEGTDSKILRGLAVHFEVNRVYKSIY